MRATTVLHSRTFVPLPWALVGDFTMNTRQRKLELLMSLWAISKSVSFLCKLGKKKCVLGMLRWANGCDFITGPKKCYPLMKCTLTISATVWLHFWCSNPGSFQAPPLPLAFLPHIWARNPSAAPFREWVTDREAWHAAAHGVVNRRDWMTDLTPCSPSKKSKGAPTQEPLSTPYSKNSKPISFTCLLKQFSEQLAKSDFLFPESYLYKVKKKKKKTTLSYSHGMYGHLWFGHLNWILGGDYLASIGRKWQPTPVFLPGNPMDRGTWWATVHRITRVRHDLATKPPPYVYRAAATKSYSWVMWSFSSCEVRFFYVVYS